MFVDGMPIKYKFMILFTKHSPSCSIMYTRAQSSVKFVDVASEYT